MGKKIRMLVMLCAGGMAAGQEKPQAPETPAKSEAPEGPQSLDDGAHNNIRRAIEWKRLEYTCDGGVRVFVALSGETARVKFQDHTYLMRQARSADGAKYSDEKLAWWNKGENGFLQDDTPGGFGKMLAQNCHEEKQSNEPANAGIVSGTVTYRERMALPPDAALQMQLQDESATGTPKLLAEEKIELAMQQVPVAFELNYDPARVEPKHKCSLSARIVSGGKVLFRGDKEIGALATGRPEHVDLILKRVEQQQ
jgi:putative lipoprotein